MADLLPVPAADVRRRFPLLSVAVPTSLVGALFVASYLSLPYSPTTPNAAAILQHPSAAHWFGTDAAGFDVFARTLGAAHVDLPLAVGGTLLALVAGTALGLLASAGGRWDALIMRTMDVFQAFPVLILVLCLVTLTGGGYPIIVAAVAAANLPQFARLSRAEAATVRLSRYVLFARAIGTPGRRLIRRHLLPNVSGVLLAQLAIGSAFAVGIIAAMSFLGVGFRPPKPSWGSMIQAGATGVGSGEWWPVVFPALALAFVIWNLNLVADRLDRFYARLPA